MSKHSAETAKCPLPPVSGIHCETKFRDKKESPPVPDSTTEPAPIPLHNFQEGDDVFFQTDTDQQVFGTVSEVRGQTCLVQFGDGTEQFTSFKRLKKLFPDSAEEKKGLISSWKKKSEPTPTQHRPQQTCGSCGIPRRISAKKAKMYQEESIQFECRRCVKQNKSPNSPTAVLVGPFLTTSASIKGKLPPDVSITPMGSPTTVFTLPSTSSPHTLRCRSPPMSSAVSIPRHIQFSVLPAVYPHLPAGCFNCDHPVEPSERLHCQMCEKPCHLMCLSLNPPPLSGDKYWDVMCSACGNQNKNIGEKVKVFSCRRSLNSWADVASLLISCLKVTYSRGMFDLEKEMLPFLEHNVERLHLPRMYKSPPADARQKFILNALMTSRFRFQNGRELKRKATVWGFRNDQIFDQKKYISSLAAEIGLKPRPKVIPGGLPPLPLPQTSPSITTGSVTTSPLSSGRNSDLIRFVPTTQATVSTPVMIRMDDSPGNTYCKPSNSPPCVIIPCRPELTIDTDLGKVSGPASGTSCSSVTTVESSSSSRSKLDADGDENSRSSVITETSETSVEPCISVIKETAKTTPRKRKLSESSTSTTAEVEVPKKRKKPVQNTVGNSSPKIARASPRKARRSSLSPTKIPSEHSTELSSEEDDDTRTLERLKLQNQLLNSQFQRAIKSATISPVSSINIKDIGEKTKRGPGRPKQAKDKEIIDVVDEDVPSVRNNRKTRGRRAVDSSLKNFVSIPRRSQTQTQVKSQKVSGTTKSGGGGGVVVSRRVGTFNSISERRPIPPTLPVDPTALNLISESLYQAAAFGDYRMECLPRSPENESDKRAEVLKVFAYFRTEKENEMASCLLGRSELETRSQTRRKSELFVGSRGRDLNDFDSYDVIGKRTDPDGVTRYQILWKQPGFEFTFSEEEDKDVSGDSSNENEFESLSLLPENHEVVPPVKLESIILDSSILLIEESN